MTVSPLLGSIDQLWVSGIQEDFRHLLVPVLFKRDYEFGLAAWLPQPYEEDICARDSRNIPPLQGRQQC